MTSETPARTSIWFKLAQTARMIFWLVLTGVVLFQIFGQRDTTQKARDSIFDQFQSERKSRVIALIHRQDSQSIFGVQVSSYINIEDSEAVLRAIRLTPDEQPIDLILHTPGGLVLAAEQIAKAISEHKGKVTVFIPHYAMSGGTMIALAAAEIVMDRNAVLGPVDPQIGDVAASSILKVVEIKKHTASDETLMMADMAVKARVQVASFIADILTKRLPRKKAEELAVVLSEGRWTHDFPITVQAAQKLGFPVSTDMPRRVYQLMDFYHQANPRRPSVIYVPMRTIGPAKGDTDTPKLVPQSGSR
ncbi:MAG: SDH family Clp fold serine proteinase [Candidatus Binatia bacterium]